MNMWIPDIKDQFRLLEDWEFPLFREYRNDGLITRVNPPMGVTTGYSVEESIGCCLEAGTVLQVDRVYIRQGSSNAWSSITFYVKFSPGDKERPKYRKQPLSYCRQPQDAVITDPTMQKLKGARFWAKLPHVNEIVCEPIAEQDRVK